VLQRKHLPITIFLAGSSIEIGSYLFGWQDNHWVAKPLIVLGLMAHYYFNSANRSPVFILALFFCWVGDIFLLVKGDIFFIAGLASFLIAHVLYIICYRQYQNIDKTDELMGSQKVRFSLPFILICTGLVVILFPVLGDLKIPVMIYALVLLLMVLNALFRYGRTTFQSFLFIFIGAILFMVSDSMLAINKFLHSFTEAGVLIMITYCAAQFLIVQGTLAHEKISANN
jgi:uncharacterized membrane protein YhhN